MFSTKTRTTVVALIASLSFAGATVAPAVSQAQYKINGGKSATYACQMMREVLNEDLQNLEKARASGNQAEINKYREMVNSDMGIGYQFGCAWAAAVSHAPVVVLGTSTNAKA